MLNVNSEDFIIIPAIDILNGNCVRLKQGDYNREKIYSENPVAQAEQWRDQGASFVHLVDLDGAKLGCPVNLEVIEKVCTAINVPCELGGGVRTIADAEKVFEAGVQRVILGTIACEQPELVESMLAKFGADRVVIGIDAKNGKASSRGWLRDTDLDATILAANFAKMGVKRFIFTDIATDGMLSGPNFQGMIDFCDAVPDSKVIASGGVSTAAQVKEFLANGRQNLEGAIVGKALYEESVTLKELLLAAKRS